MSVTCNIPDCRRNRVGDGDDEDQDEWTLTRASGADGEEDGEEEVEEEEFESVSVSEDGSHDILVTPTVRKPYRRTHNLSIFDPPPSVSITFKQYVLRGYCSAALDNKSLDGMHLF